MAKDGTVRGGPRPGSGRKHKLVPEDIEAEIGSIELPDPEELEGTDIPEPMAYLSSPQKGGEELQAMNIYTRTYLYLKQNGCEQYVNPQLVEQYAMSYARYVQCEEAISKYGFLSKHPTTGAACSSPFVQIASQYHKQAYQNLYMIASIVQENSTKEFQAMTINDELMEQILNS